MNNNYSTDPRQLVPLWEEMGASTGGLIGRFIGLNFLMGARILSSFINPLGINLNRSNPYISDFNNENNSIEASLNKNTLNESRYNVIINTPKENEDNIKDIIFKHHGIVN